MSLLSWVGRKIKLTDAKFWSVFLGGETWAGEPVTVDTAMQVSAFWACVRLIAKTQSTLPIGLYEPGADGRKSRSDHPLYKILHDQPNGEQSACRFWEGMIAWSLVGGTGYAPKVFRGRQLIALNPPLNPHYMIAERTDLGALKFTYRDPLNKNKETPYTEDELFVLPGFGFGAAVGLSPLQYARQSLSSARATERAAASHFANGMRPSGWLVYKGGGVLEESQRELAKQNLINPMSGAENWGKIGILEGDFDYRQMTIAPEEAQMLESRRFSVEDVCFVAETKIITIGGARRIDEVCPGDLVLTHRGRWRAVTRVMSRDYVGTVVETAARGLSKVTSTRNHPFFAQAVKPSRSHRIEPIGSPDWIASGNLVAPRRQSDGRRARGGFHALTMPRMADDRISLIDLADWAPENAVIDVGCVRASSNGRATPAARKIALDHDFGWLCGLYAAEGSVSDHQVVFYLGAHETEIVETLVRRIRACLGVRAVIRDAGSVSRVEISHRIVRALFAEFGCASHLKRLPGWCMKAGAEFRRGLIDGLLAGDGCVYRGRSLVRTTSEALAWQIRLLMWARGRHASLSTAAASVWAINGRAGVSREIFTVEWRSDPERRGSMGVAEQFVYFGLETTERSQFAGKVYNLEVEEDESYTTEGGCVHNCRWHGVPPILIGHASQGQTMWGSGVEQILLGWYTLSLRSDLVRIEQEIKRQLMTPEEKASGLYAEHAVEGLLRADSAARGEFYWKLFQMGAINRDWIADKENAPRPPGGDRYYLNQTLAALDETGVPIVPAAIGHNGGPPLGDLNPAAPPQQPPQLKVVQ